MKIFNEIKRKNIECCTSNVNGISGRRRDHKIWIFCIQMDIFPVLLPLTVSFGTTADMHRVLTSLTHTFADVSRIRFDFMSVDC